MLLLVNLASDKNGSQVKMAPNRIVKSIRTDSVQPFFLEVIQILS